MKLLIVTGQPFIPQMRGGLQSSGDTLARMLMKRGHGVAVLAALMPNGFLGIRGRLEMKLLGHKAAVDHELGYTCYRSWFPWKGLEYVVAREKPDIVVVLARQSVRMALEAKRLGLPVVMSLQDVEFDDHGGPMRALGDVACVANSQFTADKYREAFGITPRIIHPLIQASRYTTESTRSYVTFINPHPKKGLDIALGVAAQCPDIPFAFVEGWPLEPEERAALNEQLARLPNVTLFPSTGDMHKVYGECKILLAPSRWEEAYGRVASEAQFSGIPVVASTRGGLPEAVGDGGVLLDMDAPVEHWAAAVQQLWADPSYYEQLSTRALAHVSGPAHDVEHQIDQWEQALRDAMTSSPRMLAMSQPTMDHVE